MLETTNSVVVEMVSPNSLRFAPFNPPTRTDERSVAGLKQQIERAGKIISPLIVAQGDYVADGHRRLTVARELGFDLVPIIREDLDLVDLWAILNGGNRPVSMKDWMIAVRRKLPVEEVPIGKRRPIEDLIRVMGKKEFEKITDEGRGPSIIIIAQSVAKYCGHPDDEFVRRIVNWFRTVPDTVRNAKYAVSTHCPPEVILDAMDRGKTINQFWGVSA